MYGVHLRTPHTDGREGQRVQRVQRMRFGNRRPLSNALSESFPVKWHTGPDFTTCPAETNERHHLHFLCAPNFKKNPWSAWRSHKDTSVVATPVLS